jgi:hypothetical protein
MRETCLWQRGFNVRYCKAWHGKPKGIAELVLFNCSIIKFICIEVAL